MDEPEKPASKMTPRADEQTAPPDEPARVNLGRLDQSAQLPEIPPGATVTVRVVNRPQPTDSEAIRAGIPSWGQKYVDNLNKAVREKK